MRGAPRAPKPKIVHLVSKWDMIQREVQQVNLEMVKIALARSNDFSSVGLPQNKVLSSHRSFVGRRPVKKNLFCRLLFYAFRSYLSV